MALAMVETAAPATTTVAVGFGNDAKSKHRHGNQINCVETVAPPAPTAAAGIQKNLKKSKKFHGNRSTSEPQCGRWYSEIVCRP